jgi:hypothetical protein
MHITDFIKDARKYMVDTSSTCNYIGLTQQIRQYRTIALQLPRGSGKTYAANKIHTSTSSLMYGNYLSSYFDYEVERRKFMGRSFSGLKLNCVIFDEYRETPEDFYKLLLSVLIPARLVSEDFHIIRLYT